MDSHIQKSLDAMMTNPYFVRKYYEFDNGIDRLNLSIQINPVDRKTLCLKTILRYLDIPELSKRVGTIAIKLDEKEKNDTSELLNQVYTETDRFTKGRNWKDIMVAIKNYSPPI